MTEQFVVVVDGHLTSRGRRCKCHGGFVFEVFRGGNAECTDIAGRIGGAYSDRHCLNVSRTSVITAEQWQSFIDSRGQ